MDRARLAASDPDLSGLRVLVVGAGRSGVAAARLAAGRDARVTLCDRAPAEEIAGAVAALRSLGVRVHADGHPPELADGTDLVVVSPGVAPDVPLLRRARQLGLPVWGEVELAARFCRGHIVGITGSNGKSTVTTMTGGILRRAGVPGATGGNLDRPLAELLDQDSPDAWHALELSSFQLETVATLRADVAVLLNLSPDHLDRHASLDEYADAKARLLELQESSGFAVLNGDDPQSTRFRTAVRGRLYLFSTRSEPDAGAFVRGGRLVLRTDHGEEDLLGAAELPVPGEHNLSNALAAALACRLAGCRTEAIAHGLREYRGLPHRLELVRELDGVRFYDDSKATNPASTACALRSFPAGSMHLILGGRDKGADWSSCIELVRERARTVLLVGEAAPGLERLLGGGFPLRVSGTIARAVAQASQVAARGDVILLSPGCASFDQYRNFAERGDDFRRVVLALPGPGGSHG